MNKVKYMDSKVDSPWVRDFGPVWARKESDGMLAVIDFEYNRPRPLDNGVPAAMAELLGVDYAAAGMTHTGGNLMVDSMGAAASTSLVATENEGKSMAEVKAVLKSYLGVDAFYTHADPTGTYIEHIDCWSKWLSPTDVLVGRYKQGDSRAADMDEAAQYLASVTNGNGEAFNVHRVDIDDTPYTNSLILNDRVYVPISGTCQSCDDTALETYRTILPDVTVVGVAASSNSPWEESDALHCRVRAVPAGAGFINGMSTSAPTDSAGANAGSCDTVLRGRRPSNDAEAVCVPKTTAAPLVTTVADTTAVDDGGTGGSFTGSMGPGFPTILQVCNGIRGIQVWPAVPVFE